MIEPVTPLGWVLFLAGFGITTLAALIFWSLMKDNK